ncbi:hypothetical protein CIL05_12195 [Virgibacillus profundi]|uniref:Uncharacterized protein n=1 Tax=Virgibacillus profundi TaxID=2024555 RepID=A0A2A2IDE3_9BACI|nr:hypothetical protein [Virgibacillus profundi]PAV29155.1 hypothetical protein CIL05_12195 [Virgibacillus profundi]PXY53324.1 hypothetical protein CIT14_12320 [Virgibacillus profundi]
MSPRKLDNRGIVLMISRTIITIILIFGIYTFFNKEPIAAKLLAMGGSIGLLFLLIMSFRSSPASSN